MGGQTLLATGLAVAVGLAGAGETTGECPAPLGSLAVAEIGDLAAKGDRVYLAAGTVGLLVVDLSDPTRPVVVGTWRPPGPGVAEGVAVEGWTVYVAAGSSGMRVLDLSDPAAPVEVGAVAGNPCLDVDVAGGLAYLALGLGGLRIVDVSDPGAPVAIGSYLFGHADRVAVGGPFAFVSGGCHSTILDVGDPRRPSVVSAPGVGAFNAAAVAGDHAYLAQGCATGPGRLAVVDLAAASGPAEVGALQLPEPATAVAVDRGLAWVAAGGRVVVVDVADPTLPAPVGSYRVPGDAAGVALTADLAAVAGRGLLEVLDGSGCAAGQVSSYLMGAAHLDGDAGTRWRTDLEVCNLDPVDRQARMDLLLRGQANLDPPTVSVVLPAAQCVNLADVVGSLFASADTAGAVRVSSTVRLPCSARTYNLTALGTYGSFALGRSTTEAVRSGETGLLIQLSHSASLDRGFRTNLELVSVTGSAITVEVELYSAGGTLLGTLVEELEPFADVQLNKVFQLVYPLDVDHGFALVRTTTPGGAFLAAATVVDNRTGDASSVPVIRR